MGLVAWVALRLGREQQQAEACAASQPPAAIAGAVPASSFEPDRSCCACCDPATRRDRFEEDFSEFDRPPDLNALRSLTGSPERPPPASHF